METNNSIISREIIAIDERTKIGKVKDVTVDCEKRAVDNLIIESGSTHGNLALPFDKTISIGDTFVVVQSRDDLLSSHDAASKLAILDGYNPVGCEVFSLAGDRIGAVESFSFDEVFGTISRITLEDDSDFAEDAIVFLSPDYVFVDNGQETAKMRRDKEHGGVPAKSARPDKHQQETRHEPLKKEPEPEPQPEPEPAESAASEAADKKELREALLGETLQEDVKSDDGDFKAEKGDKIDEKMLDKAEEHDALILLTMAIDF